MMAAPLPLYGQILDPEVVKDQVFLDRLYSLAVHLHLLTAICTHMPQQPAVAWAVVGHGAALVERLAGLEGELLPELEDMGDLGAAQSDATPPPPPTLHQLAQLLSDDTVLLGNALQIMGIWCQQLIPALVAQEPELVLRVELHRLARALHEITSCGYFPHVRLALECLVLLVRSVYARPGPLLERLAWETHPSGWGVLALAFNATERFQELVDHKTFGAAMTLAVGITTKVATNPATVPEAMFSHINASLAVALHYYAVDSPKLRGETDQLATSLGRELFWGWATGWSSSHPYVAGDYAKWLLDLAEIDEGLREELRVHQVRAAANPRLVPVFGNAAVVAVFVHQWVHGKFGAKPTVGDTCPLWLALLLALMLYIGHYRQRGRTNRETHSVMVLTMETLAGAVPLGATIDEAQYRLCRLDGDAVPLSADLVKPVVLYMLDVVQTTLRYELNGAMDVDNTAASVGVIVRVVGRLATSESLPAYNWGSLVRALGGVARLVNRLCRPDREVAPERRVALGMLQLRVVAAASAVVGLAWGLAEGAAAVYAALAEVEVWRESERLTGACVPPGLGRALDAGAAVSESGATDDSEVVAAITSWMEQQPLDGLELPDTPSSYDGNVAAAAANCVDKFDVWF